MIQSVIFITQEDIAFAYFCTINLKYEKIIQQN